MDEDQSEQMETLALSVNQLDEAVTGRREVLHRVWQRREKDQLILVLSVRDRGAQFEPLFLDLDQTSLEFGLLGG